MALLHTLALPPSVAPYKVKSLNDSCSVATSHSSYVYAPMVAHGFKQKMRNKSILLSMKMGGSLTSPSFPNSTYLVASLRLSKKLRASKLNEESKTPSESGGEDDLMNEDERKEWRRKIREVIDMYPRVDEEVDPIEKEKKLEKSLSDYRLIADEDDPDWPEDADGRGFNLDQFFNKITIKDNKKKDDDDEDYDSEKEVVWQDDNYIRPIKDITSSEWEETVNIGKEPAFNPNWICDTPVHSEVEGKLRQLLIELGNINKILGIQVCAYKDGEVIIDTSAGVLGRYDPRPVQPDSLFPSFSTTKGVTAGMVHWLVDNGKVKLDENVANIWPEFRSNGKDIIKVHHVLNHTSGLHNALASSIQTDPELMLNWNECLRHIASSAPGTEPGREQLYHYLSFGWLCGGIIEHATGKKFQDILEEAFIRPLNIEGEMYIGIPPGVESRLATLTVDTEDLKMVSGMTTRSDLPSTFQPQAIAALASSLPVQFNTLNFRRAIIPAANGHFSARALARYYATLVDGGKVPPPHSLSSKPPLGSHIHLPEFPSLTPAKKTRNGKKKESVPKSRNNGKDYISVPINDIVSSSSREGDGASKIFNNPNIHDLFLGRGEYENLILASGKYGLGFKKWYNKDGSLVGFGHSGIGGSTGYCDIDNRFSISVTLNKMSFGSVTGEIVQFVCSELGISVPDEFSSLQPDVARPMIN